MQLKLKNGFSNYTGNIGKVAVKDGIVDGDAIDRLDLDMLSLTIGWDEVKPAVKAKVKAAETQPEENQEAPEA